MNKALAKQLLASASGFRSLMPEEAIAQQYMIDIIRRNYELAGYSPIETPLVERTAVLSAKGGGEIRSQIYGLRLLNPAENADDDSKDLALRFDQTVPLARFVAANYNELTFPFRRHVIGPVFRGERAKDGRYRQFIQADIDVIGNETLDLLHDAEMVAVVSGIFEELGVGPFTVRLGNRKILEGLLQYAGLTSRTAVDKALGMIDRLEKVGSEEVLRLLTEEAGIKGSGAKELLNLLSSDETTDEMLDHLKSKSLNEIFTQGVDELVEVVSAVRALGVSEKNFSVDISIARGLDYYTGSVYETRLDDHPEIGSVASGGRYDDLASVFTSRSLPGVGISIGVTRLLFLLIKEGLLPAAKATVAPVLVTTAGGLAKYGDTYLAQAGELRAAGIATEIYLAKKNIGKQLQFANQRGFEVVVIAQEDEIGAGKVSIKNLRTREQVTVNRDKLVETVRSILQ